jgi:hypothetical protein
MEKLIKIIGLAPSEDPTFSTRLYTIRAKALEILKTMVSTQTKEPSVKKKRDSFDLTPEETLEKMKELGISSVEELVALAKKGMEA